MATVSEVVSAGLKSIIVLGADAELEATDAQDFIFAMNNFMADLEAKGVKLGYTQVSNLADTVTVPTGALRGLIANVAVEVAPDYGGVVSPALQQRAIDGLKTMRRLGVSLIRASMPSTLPTGSGNDNRYLPSDHFYPDSEQAILSEANDIPSAVLTMASNTTDTAITTAGTAVLVLGTWSVDRSSQFNATAAGRLVYAPSEASIVNISVNVDVAPVTASNQILSVYLAFNGAVIADSIKQSQTSLALPASIAMRYRKRLEQNDYLEVFVANESSTDDLLVSAASIRIN